MLGIPEEWLWDAVRQMITAIFTHKRVAVKSGHSLSKDYTAGILALQWLFKYYPAKVITTAPTGRQVTEIMFMEIAKQFENLRQHAPKNWKIRPDMLTSTKLKINPDLIVLGFTTKETNQKQGKMQGFKSQNLLVIISEAQAVDDMIYDQITGIMTGSNCRILELGNPISPAGRFYEHCTQVKYGYHVITLSCFDSPNVKSGKKIIPGVVTKEWVEDRRLEWGEEHPYWFGRVLGEFPQDSADSIIPISWIMRQVRDQEFLDTIDGEDDLKVAGLDIAGQGHDETAKAVLTGRKLTSMHGFHKLHLDEVVGWTKGSCRQEKVKVLAFDSGGLADVGSFLRDETYMETLAINFGTVLDENANFANLASRMYWELRLAFEAGNIFIPDDPVLIGQLASRKFTWTQKGKKIIRLESKITAKQRGVPSPDRADALAMAWWARQRYLKTGSEIQSGYESVGAKENREIYSNQPKSQEDAEVHILTMESENTQLI